MFTIDLFDKNAAKAYQAVRACVKNGVSAHINWQPPENCSPILECEDHGRFRIVPGVNRDSVPRGSIRYSAFNELVERNGEWILVSEPWSPNNQGGTRWVDSMKRPQDRAAFMERPGFECPECKGRYVAPARKDVAA